uniref:Uncharacterized protein n=1 Tax=Octopus bimaculoides TaxID=37653 RepID=A0A0L8FRH9_OCTBM
MYYINVKVIRYRWPYASLNVRFSKVRGICSNGEMFFTKNTVSCLSICFSKYGRSSGFILYIK